MAEADDTYLTVSRPASAAFRDRGSRFVGSVWPVESERAARSLLEDARKRYYDATHCCYAYRLGSDGAVFRVSDDGEPSGSAGRPILGQLLSRDLTDSLVVVARWFGGTKLGIPGLINAYRSAAAAALDEAGTVERVVMERLCVEFPYDCLNAVMRIVKQLRASVERQSFDNICRMRLAIRTSLFKTLLSELSGLEGVRADPEDSAENHE